MKKSDIPFVGLHAHSVAGSFFDGLGFPGEHMDSAFENGMDALALTDHGNMNGLSYQVSHAKKMMEEGKNFKPIFGVEAYFIPSVKDWKKEMEKEELINDLKSEAETFIKKQAMISQNDNTSNNGGMPMNKSLFNDNISLFPEVEDEDDDSNLVKLKHQRIT